MTPPDEPSSSLSYLQTLRANLATSLASTQDGNIIILQLISRTCEVYLSRAGLKEALNT